MRTGGISTVVASGALLLAIGPAAARAESEASAESAHLSLRTGTFAWHLFDVSADAPFYPRKLDDEARFVFDPGLVVSFDLPTGWAIAPHLRFTLGGYSDCAAQPAGYFGVFPMSAALGGDNVSFSGGVGAGVALRRSWKRYVFEDHASDTFSDWGAVEGAVGLYGELELRLHPADRAYEVVLNVVPGVPYLVLTTVGLRVPL
jgi:hypothetical protein